MGVEVWRRLGLLVRDEQNAQRLQSGDNNTESALAYIAREMSILFCPSLPMPPLQSIFGSLPIGYSTNYGQGRG